MDADSQEQKWIDNVLQKSVAAVIAKINRMLVNFFLTPLILRNFWRTNNAITVEYKHIGI